MTVKSDVPLPSQVTRRTLLGAAAAGVAVGMAHAQGEDRKALLQLGASEAADHIRSGALSAERYVQTLLDQYERTKPLNAVTWIRPDDVLAAARRIDLERGGGRPMGRLAGVPLLVKDNIDTVGHPTSAGTPALKDNLPARNAPVVEKLLAEGASVLAKANMHELAGGITSTNMAFGAVRNPYDRARIPGGSSGGTGAGLAARIAPAGLGSDTGGSARIPAAYCGVVGLRPSASRAGKRYSDRGMVPAIADLDTVGPMARSVRDIALMDSIITGGPLATSRNLVGVRLGLPRSTHWDDLDPPVAKVMGDVLHHLRARGVTFVEVDMRPIVLGAQAALQVLTQAGASDLAAFLSAHVPQVSFEALVSRIAAADVRASMTRKATNDAAAALERVRTRTQPALARSYRQLFADHRVSAILFPTTPVEPPAIVAAGDRADDVITVGGKTANKSLTIARNTIIAPILGAPGLSLPGGLNTHGLPVGLELDALPGQDADLIALALGVEAALPKLPPPNGVL